MSIVTLCGNPANEADCGYCLRGRECREAREKICQGCKREKSGTCSAEFKRERAESGMCRGRELLVQDDYARLHGKGI